MTKITKTFNRFLKKLNHM